MPKPTEPNPIRRVATLAGKNDLDKVKVFFNKSTNQYIIEKIVDGEVVGTESKSVEEFNDQTSVIDYAANVALEKL